MESGNAATRCGSGVEESQVRCFRGLDVRMHGQSAGYGLEMRWRGG